MCDAHAPQMVLDSIPCGICIFSLRDGKIHPEYRNPAFYRILGCNEEHIAQMRTEMTFQGVHEEDKPVLRQKMEDLRSQGYFFTAYVPIMERQRTRLPLDSGRGKHRDVSG